MYRIVSYRICARFGTFAASVSGSKANRCTPTSAVFRAIATSLHCSEDTIKVIRFTSLYTVTDLDSCGDLGGVRDVPYQLVAFFFLIR